MNKATAIKYKITVHESVLAWTHGFGSEIVELFFPELGMAINQYSIHLCDKTRYDETGIKVEEKDITNKELLETLEELKNKLITQEALKKELAVAQSKIFSDLAS